MTGSGRCLLAVLRETSIFPSICYPSLSSVLPCVTP